MDALTVIVEECFMDVKLPPSIEKCKIVFNDRWPHKEWKLKWYDAQEVDVFQIKLEAGIRVLKQRLSQELKTMRGWVLEIMLNSSKHLPISISVIADCDTHRYHEPCAECGKPMGDDKSSNSCGTRVHEVCRFRCNLCSEFVNLHDRYPCAHVFHENCVKPLRCSCGNFACPRCRTYP